MSNQVELEAVIRKIRALVVKTVSNGCLEGEAMAAAAKVGELLQVYNLSLDKVFLDQQSCVTKFIPAPGKNRRPIDKCLVRLAEFCDCKIWFHRDYDHKERRRKVAYGIFGLDTDTLLFQYLYDTIDRAMASELVRFKGDPDYLHATTHRKRLTNSFLQGIAYRVARRLQVMTTERHQQERANKFTVVDQDGTVRDTDIVLVKRDKVESEWEKVGIRVGRYKRRRNQVNMSAYAKGEQAGQRVNLNRPVERKTGLAGLLG